jgi:hypothetical protein
LSYSSEGKKRAADTVALGNDDTARHIFHYRSDTTIIAGTTETEGDRLPVDNTSYWVCKRPPRYYVGIVDGAPEFGGVTAESYYVRQVFPDAIMLGEQELEGKNFPLPGVLILANVRQPSSAVETYVRNGGGVIVTAGDRYDVAARPAYVPVVAGTVVETTASLQWVVQNNPLTSVLPSMEFDWVKVLMQKRLSVTPDKDAVTLVATPQGEPVIVTANIGRGRSAFIATTVDRAWCNIAGKPVFSPLMEALARYVSGAEDSDARLNLFVGEQLRYHTVLQPGIVTPSGKRCVPEVHNGEMIFNETYETGIYRLTSCGADVVCFAVNCFTRSGESDLTPMDRGELQKAIKGARIALLSEEHWEKELTAVLRGTEISRWMLLLAMLLAGAELAILLNRGLKK